MISLQFPDGIRNSIEQNIVLLLKTNLNLFFQKTSYTSSLEGIVTPFSANINTQPSSLEKRRCIAIKIYWNGTSKNIIGENLRRLRTARGLTQCALAEALQLQGGEFSDLTILRIEKGERFVPDYEVKVLAEFFGVSYACLLDGEEEHGPVLPGAGVSGGVG